VHIPGLQAHHRTDVVAVYHRDLAKARAIAAEHGIPHACDSVEAIVALPAVQAVTIATPPFLHHSQAKTVLEAGKHLLLESPRRSQEPRRRHCGAGPRSPPDCHHGF
jgi:predicted dehydrogenase